ncbi:MAG: thiamine pyrophosphate-binding protein [Elusimicrobia bacterium]|nr:thiamine pyrophosphate-binding protein [Elusimicrobiota bacterium]
MSARDSDVRPAVHVLLDYLEREGVRHVFGIPGGPIIPLYEAMHARGVMTPVLAKHEGGAAFMADAYARATGRVGVCCTTTGPGATNALTGLAVSQADQVPVLLLTAQVPTRQFGMGAFQESSPEISDIVALFKPVTKWSTMLHHPSRMGATARAALRIMQTGRPGPVHLSLPLDYITQPVADELIPPARYRPGIELFDRSSVREAVGLLLAARRPAILAGAGVNVSRAWTALRALAERLDLPVATSFRAKGCLPEDHPLSLGVLGPSGSPDVRERLLGPETDLLLVVGSSLGEVTSCGFDERLAGKSLLQIDVDPAVIGRNFPVAVGLTGDARSVLVEMLHETGRRLDRAGGAPAVRPAPPAVPDEPTPREHSAGYLPQTLLKELRRCLPADAMLFVDNGSIRSWVGRHFPVLRENSFFVNMGLASMGYAVAGAVGAQLACPERVVVALAGDAAFAMNGMEVHTAVECGAPVIWVIVNNGGHGMIYHGERALYGGRFHSSVFRRPLDVVSVARGLGAAAFRVERPGQLAEAMAAARALRAPAVIDVLTALGDAPPMGARVRTIQKELVAA